ncbi:MAG TPA: aryl-sulfate sulfotransferase [Candidatus Coprovivens excrementavium]|nr:aryl-sulfate sulfotransferase [Candidatus Coprovivens excrementavium]
MKKRKIFIILGVVILVALLVLGGFWIGKNKLNKEEVEQTESMIALQKEKEENFKIEGYTIDNPNIILNPYGNSPLSALVIFETENEVTPKVTIKGDDKLSTFTHEFEEGKEHYLPIYGLYADRENEVVIEYEENGKEINKTIKIKTDKLPEDMALPTEVNAKKSKLNNDLYFFTPSSSGYTMAYDVNGDVRWYLTNYALWKIDRLENGHLLVSTERLINSPYYMTGLYEMDLLGKIYNEYSLEGGYHHDYYEMENGNLLIASDDFNNDSGTVEDYIVELDRKTGEIVKTFDLKDVLKMTDGQSENWSDYDWFHNNSVWYDKETNSITLSGRHQDAVINIDYDTGELNWIIGDSTNWSDEYQKYFFTPVGDNFEWQWSQHAAMITPEGYVFILDNGNNKSKIKEEYVDASDSYTRGVMYKIDTDEMTIEQVWEYGKERGSEFYSPYISDVDYLAKDHYIVHSGGIVYVDGKNSNQPAGFSKNAELLSDTVELLDDEVIFEIKLPTNNYRVEKMSLYYEDENFKIEDAERIGSLGETKIDDKKITLNIFAKKIDDTYKSHNISITKEIDRLVVKGQFKRTDTVNIVLYKNITANYYNFKISKKPYTALCVDIFTEEETKNGIVVTKNINEDGLNGKYAVYIEINGTLYNTNEYVEY